MTKLFLLSITCCVLGGCGTYGEPLFLARMYDASDPCQLQNIPGANIDEKIARMPRFCGASGGRTYIYTNSGQRNGYIKPSY